MNWVLSNTQEIPRFQEYMKILEIGICETCKIEAWEGWD